MATSNPVAAAIADAVSAVLGVPAAELKVEAPPRRELGDYAVGMFAVAKQLRQPPPAIAARVAAELPRTGFVQSAAAAGPFVNIKIDRAAAIRWVIDHQGALVPPLGAGKTVCIDYSSPNISKHLAYHHIRSTMLGHAIANLHRALGYRVIGVNHVGDWGTTHGMLLAAYERWGKEYAGYPDLDVTALNDLYVRWRDAMKTDKALEAEGRRWFKRLEDGEPEVRARWQQFRDTSLAEFRAVYDILGVDFDDWNGESFYEDKMPPVIDAIAARGLSTESEGALVVPLEGEKVPLLLKTADGTTLYATRDLAAAIYRWETYHFDRSLYVVDRGQAQHFRQLFAVLRLMGHEWASRCEHVPFGLVRIAGRKTTTRGGDVVLLKEVFAEAAEKVRGVIAEANPELPTYELERTAYQVGVGAVVFANVLPQRDKDVDFEWDKIMSLTGDSGPYVQYSHARCASVARKAGGWPDGDVDAALVAGDLEWAVAQRILELGDQVARAAQASEPHVVAHYLLELAADLSRWYTAGNTDRAQRILCDDPALRAARLALLRAAQAALAQGLGILGMAAPDVM